MRQCEYFADKEKGGQFCADVFYGRPFRLLLFVVAIELLTPFLKEIRLFDQMRPFYDTNLFEDAAFSDFISCVFLLRNKIKKVWFLRILLQQ